MDASSGITAAELLAQASEAELARLLWEYGEERQSRRIAKEIVAQRRKEPLQTTGQLAKLVERCIPRSARPPETHVATRTFQGIRIAINSELEQLQTALDAVIDLLRPGGRIVVICFHSLESRIVKQTFARRAGRIPNPPGSSPAAFLKQPDTGDPALQLITKKPVTASPDEAATNPRARSASLRAAQRLA
jgi:16S rRNA (cytosine1402-N4)-methyltransferase